MYACMCVCVRARARVRMFVTVTCTIGLYTYGDSTYRIRISYQFNMHFILLYQQHLLRKKTILGHFYTYGITRMKQ